MSVVDKKRKLYIDIAKVAGIILVVLGHSFGGGIFAAKIYHMPLFFVISGLTLNVSKDSKFSGFAVKKLKRLYIPFIIYELIYLVLNSFLVRLGLISMKFSTMGDYCKALLHIVLFDNYNVLLSPIWFLSAMFFAVLIAFLIVKIVNLIFCKSAEDDNCIAVCLAISVILIYCGLFLGKRELLLINSSFSFTQIINVVMEATGYILLGFCVKNVKGDLVEKLCSNRYFELAGTVLFILLIVFERLTHCKADMRANTYDYVALQPVFAIVGIAYVFILGYFTAGIVVNSNLNRIKKLIIFISDNTVAVMCLHYTVFKIVGLLQVGLLGYDRAGLSDWQLVSTSLASLVVMSCLGVLIPLALCFVRDKVISFWENRK